MFFVGGWLGAVGNGFVHGGKSVIVDPFLRPQLQKNSDFCNCWEFFEQTITDEGGVCYFFCFLRAKITKKRGFMLFGTLFSSKNNKRGCPAPLSPIKKLLSTS